LTSLGADDVIFTIQRTINPKTPGFVYGFLDAIDPNGIKKLDKRTVRLHLKYPNSQISAGFKQIPSSIVPVGFDPKNPVGTGPFKQTGFTPEQRWTGVRNPNYWRQGLPYLDGLEILGFSNPDVARLNALLSGQADGLDRLNPAQLSQVKARSDLATNYSQTGEFMQIEMRCAKGDLFEDKRVRLAFKLMVNRPQLVESIYDGYGEVGNDTGSWALFDPSYDASLPQREQDLEQARSLLKAAGKDGMHVGFRAGEITPGAIAAGDVLIQQAKAAGVTMTLNVVANLADFYGSSSYETAQLKQDFDFTQTMYENAAYCWLPGSLYNNTGYNDPRVNSLYKQALATTGAKYNELMNEMSRVIWAEGPWVVWGRKNLWDAYSKKFTGIVPDSTAVGFNGMNWLEVSLA
jgi:peptide/nickel transport system substrate-binding protein